MKKLFPLILVALSSLAACKKDNNNSPADEAINGCGGTWDASKGQIKFKVDGVQVNSYNHTCSWSYLGGEVINFTSSMHKDGRTVLVNVDGWNTGIRNLGMSGDAYGSYFPHYCDFTAYSFKSGTVNITRFDTTALVVEGTFSGTAEKDGTTYQITDGQLINCKLERF